MKPNRIPEKSQKATSTQSEGVWDFSGILWIINCAALVLTGSTLGPSCGNLGPSFLPHMFAQPTHSKNLPARESTKCRHKGSARLGGGRHSPPGGLSIKSAAPAGRSVFKTLRKICIFCLIPISTGFAHSVGQDQLCPNIASNFEGFSMAVIL